MAVFRVVKNDNYTTVSNHHLKDRDISLKAKGLLTVMLSLPDDWDYSISGLVSLCKEGRGAVETTLKELKEAGYLVVTKMPPSKDNGGRISYIYDIHEYPNGANTRPQKLAPCIQGTENCEQLSTKESSTNKEKKKDAKKKAEQLAEIVSDYTRSEQLAEAINAFIEHRREIGKPMTCRSLTMMLNKLSGMGTEAQRIEALETSIMNGWTGIFPKKENQAEKKAAPSNEDLAAIEEWKAMGVICNG